MKRTAITTAALASAFVLASCGSDDDDQVGPVGSEEINPETDSGQQPGQSEQQDQQDEAETLDETSAQESEQAFDQALEDSEQLAAEEDFSEYEIGDQDFDDGEEFQAFLEERTVVFERAAEVMTGFQAGDWNKDVAVIRASHLIIDGAQQPGIPEAPQSGDVAWDVAMECNAAAEVRTEVVSDDEPDDEMEQSHSPHREVIAEYRWTGGDEDCDLEQPDHYYVYVMTMNDDAMITDFSRDQVSYDDDDPGLFED